MFPSSLRSTPADLSAVIKESESLSVLRLRDRSHGQGASYLVVDRNEWMVGREGSGGAFAVNQQCFLLPVHDVLFHFGDVVRDVVDDVHVQVVWCGGEDFCEGLKCERVSSDRHINTHKY